MAAKAVIGKLSDTKENFTSSSLVGTETITATIGAGQVGIIIDSAVPEHMVDTMIDRLQDVFRELTGKLS